jgi:hypothetical protein
MLQKTKLIFVFVALGLAACVWESVEDIAPQSFLECDTSRVTFSRDIQPILARRCFGCHQGFGDPTYEFTDFTAFQAMALNNKLLPAINQTSSRPMPKGQIKIPQCEIAKITSWVNAGAKNN